LTKNSKSHKQLPPPSSALNPPHSHLLNTHTLARPPSTAIDTPITIDQTPLPSPPLLEQNSPIPHQPSQGEGEMRGNFMSI